MSTYQRIIYPIRRTDGLIVIGSSGPPPTDPELLGMTVSGEDFEINGVSYKWPAATANPDTALTTDGAGNLTWEPVSGLGFENRIQDADGNTSVNVDLLGTGADDTIRVTSNGAEVMTITEDTSTIRNAMDISGKQTLTTTSNTAPGFFVLLFRDNLMYAPTGANLNIVDLTDLANPVTISTTNLGLSFIYTMNFYGNYIFIGTSNNTQDLLLIDISDSNSPTLAKTYTGVFEIRGLSISGSYLYLLRENAPENLEIYDISDPLNEVLLSSTALAATSSENEQIVIKDDTLYFITIEDGFVNNYLYAYDVSDPTSPSQLDKLLLTSDSSRCHGTILRGNYLYIEKDKTSIGAVLSGLITVNITDPSNLAIADTNFPFSVDSVGNNNSMVLSGNFVYILTWTGVVTTIRIYNIEDPNNITFETSIAGPTNNSVSLNAYKDHFAISTTVNTTYFVKFNVGYNQFLEAGNISTNLLQSDGDITVSQDVTLEDSADFTGGLGVTGDLLSTDELDITQNLVSDGKIIYPTLTTSSTTLTLGSQYSINATNQAVAFYTLPEVSSSNVGQRYVITQVTNNDSDIHITASGSDEIFDGLSDVDVSPQKADNDYNVFEVFNNGAKWLIKNNLTPNLDAVTWIVVSGGTQALSTDNGLTWSTSSPANTPLLGVAYNGSGRWVGGNASTTNRVVYSDNDGTTWNTTTGAPAFNSWTWKPAYSSVDDRWVTGGRLNVNVGYSDDNGATWTNQLTFASGNGDGGTCEYNGVDLYMMIGEGFIASESVWTSADGISWTINPAIPLAFSGPASGSGGLAYNAKFDRWMVGGRESGTAQIYYTDNDGGSWTAPTTNVGALSTIIYALDTDGGSTWVAGGTGANTLLYSTDGGDTWTGLGNGIFDVIVENIQYNGFNRWIAVGSGNTTNSVAYSNDGINWVALGKPGGANFRAVGSKRLRH